MVLSLEIHWKSILVSGTEFQAGGLAFVDRHSPDAPPASILLAALQVCYVCPGQVGDTRVSKSNYSPHCYWLLAVNQTLTSENGKLMGKRFSY